MPEFNSCQSGLCGPERFEAQHRSGSPFNEPVILFNNIIQVFALADFHSFTFIVIVLLDSCSIGAAFVDIDQAGLAAESDSLVQKSPCCLRITLGSE